MTDTTPTAPLEGIVLSAEPETALVAVQPTAKPLDLFTTAGVVPALVARIRQAALEGFTPSLDTEKSRKEIASRAYRVTRAKTALDDLGKEEVARLKELPKTIDAGRKALRDALDILAEEIRQPLTQWEARRKQLADQLAVTQNLPARLMTATAAVIRAQVEAVQAMDTTEATWGEFAGEAQAVQRVTLLTLQEMAEKAQKAEDDAAELERLRKEKAERDRLDREEQLRREGEERARAAAQAAPLPIAVTVNPALPEGTVLAQGADGSLAAIVNAGDDPRTPAGIAQRPIQPGAGSPSAPTDQQAQPSAAAPLAVAQADALRRGVDPAADLEHRRACNREALADLVAASRATQPGTPIPPVSPDDREAICTAILRAIVTGKVRRVAITY